MPKTSPNLRNLEYADFDAMLKDVEALIEHGYQKNGKWTLGQATGHVADWMRFPIEGFPNPPAIIRAVFWVMNVTGKTKSIANKILTNGFKPGMATAPVTVPASDFSDREGLEKLKAAVQKVKEHEGPLHESPLFGKMDKATHVKVSLLHAAHHFRFLEPRRRKEDT